MQTSLKAHLRKMFHLKDIIHKLFLIGAPSVGYLDRYS